jgi:hypothetical protein
MGTTTLRKRAIYVLKTAQELKSDGSQNIQYQRPWKRDVTSRAYSERNHDVGAQEPLFALFVNALLLVVYMH